MRLCQQDSTPKCNAVGIKIVRHFSLLREHSWAYLCLMSFYLIGTAFPLSYHLLFCTRSISSFFFLHLTFEQNSVICPPQGSLQRFFRGGGLSPPAKVKVGNSLHPMQNSGLGKKVGPRPPRLREFFRHVRCKSGKQQQEQTSPNLGSTFSLTLVDHV